MVLGRGYHATMGGLLIEAGDLPPRVPLDESVAALVRLVDEFDFAGEGDRSRALAAFLTPAMRMGGFLPCNVPIDAGEADQSQSGKGYRHQLVCEIYREAAYVVTSRSGGVGSSDESFAAALVAGRPFVCLDNFRGKMDSQHLESFLTAPGLFSARVPCRPEMQIDPRRFLLQLSSNGFQSTADLANRSSICRIRKRPGYRYRDTLGELQRRQSYFLGCVFSVITAWIESGKPVTAESRHDFWQWAQPLDWIVQNILKQAPLMTGHAEAQQRISDPTLSWLRSIAIVLEAEHRLDQSLLVGELVELGALHAVELPGSPRHDDDANAKRHAGRLMARAFDKSDELLVEGYRIHRSEAMVRRDDDQGTTLSKHYVFHRQ